MEECENLCDRLTIMTGGQMKCIGTAQHLKQRYAQGFSILIKTCEVPDEEVALLALKRHMCRIFGDEFCNLKDEHKVGFRRYLLIFTFHGKVNYKLELGQSSSIEEQVNKD